MCRLLIYFLIGVSIIIKSKQDDDEVSMDRRRVAQEAEIMNNLLDGYNPEVRPSGSVLYEGYHRPVVVTVNMYIRSIRKVDDAEMQYDVDVTLRQKWRDDRLSYAKEGPDSITLKDPHKIWTPDSFFANEYEGQRHMLDQPNTLVRISRDGSVFYSTRLSLALTCAMDFARFPFDNQTCSLTIESYGYTEDDIVYAWDNDNPIKHSKTFTTSSLFDVTNITYEGGSTKVKEHVYAFVKAVFHLQRRYGYYLTHFYIPSAMWVVISWLAFFLHPSKTTARTIIGFGSVAVFSLMILMFNNDIPRTSYSKSIDIWTGVTITFIFFSLIESILVCRLHSARHDCCEAMIAESQEIELVTSGTKWNARKRQRSVVGRIRALLNARSEKIDRISMLVFPSVFFAFVVFYSIVCWLM